MATIDDLPVELLVLCLLLLSLRDRLCVQRISRKWREIATAFPELWTRLDFHHKPEHRAPFLLALTRAGTLPLEATWKFGSAGFEGFDILEANISRVRVLSVKASSYYPEDEERLLRLLDRPLPVLEIIRVDWMNTFSVFAQWGNRGAPHLREVSVRRFLLHPDSGQFNALRCFRGEVDKYSRNPLDPRIIFELCPALVELELSGVMTHTVQCLAMGPIPSTLSCLSLLPQRAHDLAYPSGTGLDYGPVLSMLGRMPDVLRMFLATDLCSAVRHYSTHVPEPFSMAFGIYRPVPGSSRQASFDIRLESSGLITLEGSTPDLRGALDRTPGFVPYLHRLANLECPTEVLDRLLRINATLPALHSLTLLVRGQRPYGDLNYCHFHQKGHLVVPQLRSLTVDTTDTHPSFIFGVPRWFAHAFPMRVTQWLRFDAPRLQTMYCYLHRSILTAPVLRRQEFFSWVERAFVGWRADWEQALVEKGTWYVEDGRSVGLDASTSS